MEPSDAEALFRLDSYPYRHRAGEVASRPLVTAEPGMTVQDAARAMARAMVRAMSWVMASAMVCAMVWAMAWVMVMLM